MCIEVSAERKSLLKYIKEDTAGNKSIMCMRIGFDRVH